MRYRLIAVLVLLMLSTGSAFAQFGAPSQPAKRDGWWIKVSTEKPASQGIGFCTRGNPEFLRSLEYLESGNACRDGRLGRIFKQPDALYPCANDQRPEMRLLCDVQIQGRQIF